MAPIDIVAMAARFVAGGTLVIAAWTKLRDLDGFAVGLHDFDLVSGPVERLAVRLVPVLELVVGVLLIFGLALPWSALAAAALFGAFGFAIAITIRRGRDIACHCFGASEQHRIDGGALLRSGVLVAIALVAAAEGTALNWPALLGAPSRSEAVPALVAATAALAFAVVVAEALVQATESFREARRMAPILKAMESTRYRRCRAVGGVPTRIDVDLEAVGTP